MTDKGEKLNYFVVSCAKLSEAVFPIFEEEKKSCFNCFPY